jgi:hypothetical protein
VRSGRSELAATLVAAPSTVPNAPGRVFFSCTLHPRKNCYCHAGTIARARPPRTHGRAITATPHQTHPHAWRIQAGQISAADYLASNKR